MSDKIPTPEETAAAAKELAEAKADLGRCERCTSEAQSRECVARNRITAAAKKLRELTDKIVPPERTRGVA